MPGYVLNAGMLQSYILNGGQMLDDAAHPQWDPAHDLGSPHGFRENEPYSVKNECNFECTERLQCRAAYECP